MGVTVVVSGGNVNVTTSQQVITGVVTVENTDQSYQESATAGTTHVIPDITVSNSDESYSVTDEAAIDIEIPDITITKNDDSTVTYPAAKDLDIGVIDPCVPSAPSGWAAMVTAYGIGYSYPDKTGQTTSYRTGDDKDIEDTIFTAAARSANGLKPKQSLSSYAVLNNNNAFGNTNRFTDSVGGQDYDGTGGSEIDYVIDHYTGLGWRKTAESGNDNWNEHIDNALASTANGFSDWFAPNMKQLITIFEWGLKSSPYYTTVFSFGTNLILCSTSAYSVSSHYLYTTNQANWKNFDKAGDLPTVFCRKHY